VQYQQAANIEARIFQLGADEEFEQETAGENEVFFDYLEKVWAQATHTAPHLPVFYGGGRKY